MSTALEACTAASAAFVSAVPAAKRARTARTDVSINHKLHQRRVLLLDIAILARPAGDAEALAVGADTVLEALGVALELDVA